MSFSWSWRLARWSGQDLPTLMTFHIANEIKDATNQNGDSYEVFKHSWIKYATIDAKLLGKSAKKCKGMITCMFVSHNVLLLQRIKDQPSLADSIAGRMITHQDKPSFGVCHGHPNQWRVNLQQVKRQRGRMCAMVHNWFILPYRVLSSNLGGLDGLSGKSGRYPQNGSSKKVLPSTDI